MQMKITKKLGKILAKYTCISRLIPDRLYLRLVYNAFTNKKLSLNNPITFNVKIQWLKLNDRNSRYTEMVDKYEAKKLVAGIIGG